MFYQTKERHVGFVDFATGVADILLWSEIFKVFLMALRPGAEAYLTDLCGSGHKRELEIGTSFQIVWGKKQELTGGWGSQAVWQFPVSSKQCLGQSYILLWL